MPKITRFTSNSGGHETALLKITQNGIETEYEPFGNDVDVEIDIPSALAAGSGISINDGVISRRVQLVTINSSYADVRNIINAGDLPVLDVVNGSMHNLYVCTMYRGSDIQFVGSAYGQTTLYTLASNSIWTSQILEPQILPSSAGKILAVNSAGTGTEWKVLPTIPSLSRFYHSQQVSINAGVVSSPERYNLDAFVPAGKRFVGTLTIEAMHTSQGSGAYHYTLGVPGASMRCIFGTYPAIPQSGHTIGMNVDNPGNTQFQLYFELSGTFEAQNINVYINGMMF